MFCFFASGFIFNSDGINESNEKDVISYVKKNIDLYSKEPLTVKNFKKRMKLISTKENLEKYVLKIDAGNIRNKKLRKKIIALRRKALKNRNSDRFVINSFDNYYNNRLGGKIGCSFRGQLDSFSPWLKYEKVNEDGRIGKKKFKFYYDVEYGEVSFYNEVNKVNVLKHYNAFSIKVKGDILSYMIRLVFNDKSYFETIVDGVTVGWKTFVIPFSDFNKEDSIDFEQLDRIEFVLNDDLAGRVNGIFFLNDFTLRQVPLVKKQKERTSFCYEVEGAVPLGTDTSLFKH